MIRIDPHAEGCVLRVRAQPGAKRCGVVGVHGEAVKVAVAAPADQGKANRAIGETLADALGAKRAQVELVSGPTSRDKRFLIRGVTEPELRKLLSALIG